MIFETERLTIRPWTLDDADVQAAFRMYGDAEVMRYLGRDGASAVIQSIEEMQERLGKAIEKYRLAPDKPSYLYAAIVPKETSGPIGTVLLKPLELSTGGPAEEVEIGWHLARDQWGKGYGTEAGRGIMRFGFEQLGVSELHAVAYPQNLASIRIMQKIGMNHRGQTDRYYGVTAEHYVIGAQDIEPS